MSVTSGFFDSVSGDRKYNAEQMASIFDGLILDGVYSTIGRGFMVRAMDNDTVAVDTGRAWFDHTWIYNDSVLTLNLPESEAVLGRIDAVIIEVNKEDSVRDTSIKIVKGIPASTPKPPNMIKSRKVNQYPLAYLTRYPNNNVVTASEINIRIGQPECPFVTGIMQTLTIESIVSRWQSQFFDWRGEQAALFHIWREEQKEIIRKWFNGLQITLNGEALTRLADIVNRFINVRTIFIDANKFTQDSEQFNGAYFQVIEAIGINENMKPIVSLYVDIDYISEHITDRSSFMKKQLKAYSCIDAVFARDNDILVLCYRKKPKDSIMLQIKGV